MANRKFLKNSFATLTPDVVKLFGYVVTGADGAVTTASTKCDGFSIALTGSEAGRYTITLNDKYDRFLGCHVTVNGADDAAYTDDKGLSCMVRAADDINSGASKVFYLQFVAQLTDTGASTYVDADLEDNAEFTIEITLKNSAVKGAQL